METRTRTGKAFTCLAFGHQSQACQTLAQTALQRHIRGLMQSRKIGRVVFTIDGRNFSGVQARLAALARSLLATALRPIIPVVIELTNFSENLREHEFGYWLNRPEVRLTTYALGAYNGLALSCLCCSASTYHGIFQTKPWTAAPSHPASLLDRQAPLERHV